jgi:hypothetical protein
VLEPLTNALAASARLSLERFSDVYLLTRALTAHVLSTTSSGRVSFALSARERELALTIGPLRAGAVAQLRSGGGHAGIQIARLADELASEPLDGSELLRVVVQESGRIPRPVHG